MSDANKRRKEHRNKVALAATATSLREARDAMKHFTLRCTDPDTKGMMCFLLEAHIAAMQRHRLELMSLT